MVALARAISISFLCSFGLSACVTHRQTTTLSCTEARAHIIKITDERLSPMGDIARWKWCNKKLIEDLAREQQILDEVAQKSREYDLDETFVREFFQKQMNLAKDMQAKTFEELRYREPDCSLEKPEVLGKLRKNLDLNSDRLLKSLQTLKAEQCSENVIFVQAGEGSFNHQAILQLLANKPEAVDLYFSGSPTNTLLLADRMNGDAFVAIRNDLVSGHYIPATLEALRDFEITNPRESLRLPINMCLLRVKNTGHLPLVTIVSHPAALEQIKNWKAGKKLVEVSEEKGTSEAARRLSVGDFDSQTGVIGPQLLAAIYDNLEVVACNLQDTQDVTTTFLRFRPKKRTQRISLEQARLISILVDNLMPSFRSQRFTGLKIRVV